jgi:fructokinase
MATDAARPVLFGEVLFDRFPDGSTVLGGAPFNVAWHLQAFGTAPLFVSRVGDDALGRRIRDAMADWGMDTSGLQSDPERPTGTVDVTFEKGEPRYDIVAERAYDFVDATTLPAASGTGLLYHGTLALRHPVSLAACETLRARSGAPVFVDVNLRPPWWDRERTASALRAARWIKLNEHELASLVRGATLEERAERFLDETGADLVVITRGERGAVARTADGTVESVRPAAPEAAVVDTVGAGDAFAAVLVLGLLRKWRLETTLARAQEFAGAIVGVRGATVSDAGFYDRLRKVWERA